jgi:RNA polymerase sigma-70 factor (ECF subfamily)
VQRYRPLIEQYLRTRWSGSPRHALVDDALQDVLLECLKADGLLARTSDAPPRSFRAFLLGAARNVALRYESGRGLAPRETPVPVADLEGVAGSEERASRAFERAWARWIVREAARAMAARGQILGRAALRRVELLRLRFFEEKPIRDIAREWGEDAIDLHREYTHAREEFRAALFEVLELHHSGRPDEAHEEAARLLEVLSTIRQRPRASPIAASAARDS